MFVTKRDGSQEELDIKKIQKVTIPSCSVPILFLPMFW
jgi:hypothetical protein